MADLITTYRDCKIYYHLDFHLEGNPPYTTPCVPDDWFWNVAAAKKAIDAKLGPEEPEEPPVFTCPECGAKFDTAELLERHIELAHPPAPPPEEESHWETTYRGIEIWHIVAVDVWTGQFPDGYVAAGFSLELCMQAIDDRYEWLEPPEDPEEGLLAQVIAAVKAWVLANMPDWVLEWGRIVNNWITNTTEYITNVVNYITEEVTNVYNDVTKYITNVYKTFEEYITNTYNYWTEEITNIYNTTEQYITNVIGVTEEWVNNVVADNRDWVRNFFKLMDPTAFLKDPMGTINAAFALQRKIAEEAFIRSFWEGFEEGLEE